MSASTGRVMTATPAGRSSNNGSARRTTAKRAGSFFSVQLVVDAGPVETKMVTLRRLGTKEPAEGS
jgi:hypothetical protein